MSFAPSEVAYMELPRAWLHGYDRRDEERARREPNPIVRRTNAEKLLRDGIRKIAGQRSHMWRRVVRKKTLL